MFLAWQPLWFSLTTFAIPCCANSCPSLHQFLFFGEPVFLLASFCWQGHIFLLETFFPLNFLAPQWTPPNAVRQIRAAAELARRPPISRPRLHLCPCLAAMTESVSSPFWFGFLAENSPTFRQKLFLFLFQCIARQSEGRIWPPGMRVSFFSTTELGLLVCVFLFVFLYSFFTSWKGWIFCVFRLDIRQWSAHAQSGQLHGFFGFGWHYRDWWWWVFFFRRTLFFLD